MILSDVLQSDLKIVFCGTAASAISAREEAYYANPSNYFWRTLYQTSLIPVQLTPEQYPQLLNYGIGLTDIAKHRFGNDDSLTSSDFDTQALHEKILKFQPAYLAFTSKKGASVFLDTPTGKLNYGVQKTTANNTKLWILPSPSGAARRYWDISIWQDLAHTVNHTRV